MANELNIDKIQIEIEASASSANTELEKLVNSLEKLKAATSGGLNGADKLAKNLKKISESLQGLNSVDGGKIDNVVNALNRISQISAVNVDLSGAENAVKSLKKITNAIADMPSLDLAKLQGLSELGNALQPLANLPDIPDMTNTAISLKTLGEAANSLSGVDLNDFAARIQQVTSALQPLSALEMSNLGSIVNALKKLPEAANGLTSIDMGAFASNIQAVSSALAPLTRQISQLANAYGTLPRPLQQAVTATVQYNSVTQQAEQNTRGIGSAIKLINFAGLVAMFKRIKSVVGEWVESSNAFVENLNLFNVAMGSAADEAYRFAEEVNKALGIDISQWIQYQGTFKAIADGFGVITDKANLMSKNLTQLGYDISSYFNLDVKDAMLKLESGIAGELEPLRRVGYALDVATLQQVAYNHGITESIQNMTQAQKAQIRYVAIMEQSKNVMGDMARTIESPANQMRILDERINQLKRSLGNALMPAISAILPYVTALVQVLGELIDKLAEFFGFEIVKFDYGDLIAAGNEEMANSFDDATNSAKTLKNTLSSIDQLNIIGKETGSKDKNKFGGYDLDLELPEYDFLSGLKEQTDSAYNAIKDFVNGALPWLEALGAAFVGIKLGQGFLSMVSALPKVLSGFKALGTLLGAGTASKLVKGVMGVAGGLAAGAASGILLYNAVKKIGEGAKLGANGVAQLAAGVTVAVGAFVGFLALKNPLGAVITAVGALIGVFAGIEAGQRTLQDALLDTIMYADNGGIAIGGLASGFSDYINAITSKNDKILVNAKAFDENAQKIQKAAGNVKDLVEKNLLLGKSLTTDEAQSIADNLKIIHDGIEQNLGLATQNLVIALRDNFSEFAKELGQDIDMMTGKLYVLQGMGNEALGKQKAKTDALLQEILDGDSSPEKLKELNEEVAKLTNAKGRTTDQIGFEKALMDMSKADINMGKPDEVKAAFEKVQNAAETAQDSINKAWIAQIQELENTKATYKALGVDIEFDTKYGAGSFEELFKNTSEIIDKGYQSQLNEVTTAVGTFAGMVYGKYKDAVQEAENEVASDPTFFQTLTAGGKRFFEHGGIVGLFDQSTADNALSDVAHDKAVKQYSNIFDEISNFADKYNFKVEDYEGIGRNMLEGMKNGVISNQSDLNETLKGIANGATNTVEGALEIKSPSRVFKGIGENLMLGLVGGIKEYKCAVLDELEDFSADITEKMEALNESMSVKMPTIKNGQQSGTSLPGALISAAQEYIFGKSSDSEQDINITLNTSVKLDDEILGNSIERITARRSSMNNGW